MFNVVEHKIKIVYSIISAPMLLAVAINHNARKLTDLAMEKLRPYENLEAWNEFFDAFSQPVLLLNQYKGNIL